MQDFKAICGNKTVKVSTRGRVSLELERALRNNNSSQGSSNTTVNGYEISVGNGGKLRRITREL